MHSSLGVYNAHLLCEFRAWEACGLSDDMRLDQSDLRSRTLPRQDLMLSIMNMCDYVKGNPSDRVRWPFPHDSFSNIQASFHHNPYISNLVSFTIITHYGLLIPNWWTNLCFPEVCHDLAFYACWTRTSPPGLCIWWPFSSVLPYLKQAF